MSWCYAHLHNAFIRGNQEAKKSNFLLLFQQSHASNVAWTYSRKNVDGKINSLLGWWTFSSIVITTDIGKCPDDLSSLQGLPELLDLVFFKKSLASFQPTRLRNLELYQGKKLSWKLYLCREEKKKCCICLVYILGNAQRVERLRLWSCVSEGSFATWSPMEFLKFN